MTSPHAQKNSAPDRDWTESKVKETAHRRQIRIATRLLSDIGRKRGELINLPLVSVKSLRLKIATANCETNPIRSTVGAVAASDLQGLVLTMYGCYIGDQEISDVRND